MGKIQARIPDQVQEIASAVIKSTGLTVSDAVRMFMTRIARDRTLPLGSFNQIRKHYELSRMSKWDASNVHH